MKDCQEKTATKVTILVAKKASGLHNLLNRHHMTNGEGLHIPVGDILKVEG